MINSGIINLNKPQNMTSHTCVQILRRITGIKRIGHTGTLDPMATGVLPICIGSAARITEYLDLDYKTYRCEMMLGIVTETLDIWGEIVSDKREALLQKQRNGSGFTVETIQSAFAGFHEVIWQTPPKYSAIRVDGRRLYEYARAGQDVVIKKRQIFIKELTINYINLDELKVSFDVTCSKGTYIRTICSDVGEHLGCGGAMSALVRLASGVFTLEDSVNLEELKRLPEHEILALLKTPDFPLVHFGKVILNEERALWFVNGGHIAMSEAVIERYPKFEGKDTPLPIREEFRRAYNMYVDSEQGEIFLGVAFYSLTYKELVADKVFYRRESE